MNKLVIMLHGVGSHGADLAPIAHYWQRTIDGLQFSAPNAPHSFMNSADGYQWFSLQGISPENRVSRIMAARSAFDQVITDILQQHKMLQQLDKVVFCGFSQGTIMALDAVVSGRWPVAGVIGLSGRLASPITVQAATTRFLLLHGEADMVIPVHETKDAAAKLRQAGFSVTMHTYPQLQHAVNQQEIATAQEFLLTI